MSRSPLLVGLWRILFYAFRPSVPFVMQTERYRLWANPARKAQGGDNTRAVIRRGRWEAFATDRLERHIKPGCTFVDAGANFGHYAMTVASLAGAEGQVWAFEPEPAAFELLKTNIALNSLANVRAECAGLSDTNGELTFTVDDANVGGHSFVAAATERPGRQVQTRVYALDAYLAEFAPSRRLDALKIDVQGYEQAVISGAMKTLARDMPVVLCEIWPEGMRAAGTDHLKLVQTFFDLGYAAEALIAGQVIPFGPTEFDAILGDGGYMDALFYRRI